MKQATLLSFFVLLLSCSYGNNNSRESTAFINNPEEWVNPLMGTDSEFALSNGNTYPAIALPWGMNFWTPQTAPMGDGWAYAYDAYKINGIKQTHQPSPWINDYAAFSLMAVVGELKYKEEERASWFSHKAEEVHPYYYSVYLADYDITMEVSPTERAAQFNFIFPETTDAYVVVDAFFKGSQVKIDKQARTVTGYCRNNSGGVPANFHNYFVMHFDTPFEEIYVWDASTIDRGGSEKTGEHVGAVLKFKTQRGEKVNVKVASSFISTEQAWLNLKTEIGADDFETTKRKAKQIWNKELSRIQIAGKDQEQIKTFYSCLYRTLLFPRRFYEYNEKGEVIHYSPYNGEVLPGYMFTDNGFWDTFRAVFPFFNLMYPSLNEKIMEGLVNTYKESGWLPEWASPGHRDCMIGSNSASIIADAYLKGRRNFDVETLYEAILKNTLSKGPVNSVGRWGAEYYNELGYVPYDVGVNENAARTLEYAYADYCIYELAKALERPEEEVELFRKRAQNYRNLYDPANKLMRGKNRNGSFQSPFNPLKWGDAFTEGNSLHYTWSVFHDVQGLIDLMGGKESFVQMLDTVFAMPPAFDHSYYGFTIHEIREMQIANMGNYAHGNQPIQHMIYLYNYAAQPWKTQYHVRNVLNKLYSSAPDGYCGDEDNGQTSAWYVFSSLGFYPVCPGVDEYVLGSPLFDHARLHLEHGKVLDITAVNNDKQHVYVESLKWNGKANTATFIKYDQLMEGGILDFVMSKEKNTDRGIEEEDAPFSMH